MSPERDPLSVPPEPDDRRILTAIAAVVVSMAIHGLMAFWLSSASLPAGAPDQRQRERLQQRRESALRVETLRPDPPPRFVTTDVPPETDSAAGHGPLAHVRELAGDPDLNATLPPVQDADAPLERPLPERPLFAADVSEFHAWVPRQVIQEITEQIVPDHLALLPRREIPLVERVPNAQADIPPFDLWSARPVHTPGHAPAGDDATVTPSPAPPAAEPPRADLAAGAEHAQEASLPEPEHRETQAEVVPPLEVPAEPETQVTTYDPMERLLSVDAVVYRRRRGSQYVRIVIDRLDHAVLPVIPKDVVLVQDVSASLAEERLRLCRRGLERALPLLAPEDRFNVMAFRDRSATLFPDWAPVRDDTLAAASAYIETFRADGATDLYASMRNLLDLPRTPGRPVIALVITDGHPNTGLTEGAKIISAFSRLNQGDVSVYTVGTQRSANAYLLDMLSYSNRGSGEIVNGGRWGIPDLIVETVRSFSRPALTDIRVRFDAASGVEVAPELSANLYADRPLVLYGRCPPETRHVVFQVRGVALDRKCDMVFELDLDTMKEADNDAIRRSWAQQYINDLLVRYTVSRDPELRVKMRRLSRSYRVPVPYADDL